MGKNTRWQRVPKSRGSGDEGAIEGAMAHSTGWLGYLGHNLTDSSSQYDAIRAYLKELDITDNVWIGLSKTSEKPNFTWTDFQPLSGEGHWHEAPSSISGSTPLCVATDAAADFQWRPLPCGGPDVASFICELPIPSWAAGPKGCLLTELPSLTVLYIPEQSALELTSDCGLDGTKRIACKGEADREEMMRQLTCTVSSEEFDDKSTKSSLVSSTEYDTSSDSSTDSSSGRTTKSSMWTSNTVDLDYGMPTRHRRETEDTLSPISTKSTFTQETTTDLSWKLPNNSDLLTETESHTIEPSTVASDETHQLSTLENNDNNPPEVTSTATVEINVKTTTTSESKTPEIGSTAKNPTDVESKNSSHPIREETTTSPQTVATKIPELPEISKAVVEVTTRSPETTTKFHDLATVTIAVVPEVTKEAEAEYPSAINQGQLFSIIENGTMFDIIELNETVVESSDRKSKTTTTQSHDNKLTTTESNIFTTTSFHKQPSILTTLIPKKKLDKTIKKTGKKNDPKIANYVPNKNNTKLQKEHLETTTQMDLNKEFEMLPIVKDSSIKLNRTFRKELPPMDSAETEDYSVPKVIDFTITNSISEMDRNVEIKLREEKNNRSLTETLRISSRKRQLGEKLEPDEMESLNETSEMRETETARPEGNVTKEDFLPKSLVGGEVTETPKPLPTEEQPRPNRKRQLTRPQHKNFYPYFFSRMLG